jgi:tetratricopeptide (TPR) repeat protein
MERSCRLGRHDGHLTRQMTALSTTQSPSEVDSSDAGTREQLRSRVLCGIWLASTIALLLRTNADVAAGDSGEIGGAAQLLGVAHPTGFALDMLLLRCATCLPLGSLAFRQNAAVACIAACAVTAVASLTWQICERLESLRARSIALGSLLSAAALLGFQTFLDSALGVEVYATALTIVACAALLAHALHARHMRAIWPLWGLTAGAHVTAGLLMLPLCAASWLRARSSPRSSLGRGLSWRALLVASGALSIAYLPLAARRDTAFDWGDPESLRGVLRHLSAARVREAYAHDMFAASHGTPGLLLFEQLARQPWLALPAALGLLVCLRRQRRWTLTLLCVLCLDLAYAVWVNPMGIAERQVGHACGALLALLAGTGVAWAIDRVSTRKQWVFGAMALALLCGCAQLIMSASWPALADGYVVAERYGALSPWLDLAPRAVYLCASDSACASSLFAGYAEGARPDVAVAPAQHLWDITVLRRLREFAPVTAREARAAQTPALRRQLAEQAFERLTRSPGRRPLYLESGSQVGLERARAGFGLERAPLLAADSGGAASDATRDEALARLASLEHARFGRLGPRSRLARESWASAYSEVGRSWLRSGQAASAWLALQWAVALTPERAVAHSNLGVAFELRGDFASALRETRRALELEIDRPTPWLNLARLMLRASGRNAALGVLHEAERRGVQDERLRELRLQLTQGTTRK